MKSSKLPIFLNKLIDTHAHLNASVYDNDLKEVIQSASQSGVEQIWDVSVDLESSRKSCEIAKKYSNVKSFIGIVAEVFIPGSDLFADLNTKLSWFDQAKKDLKELFVNNKENIVGIGETGMDYYWIEKDKSVSFESKKRSKFLQEKLFRMQLELAEELQLPLTIHSRAAELDCLKIASEYQVTGIFHSFTGDYQAAKGILDKGFALGINGIITFKNADSLREVYKKIVGRIKPDLPITDLYSKGIFFETDAPFLSPEGKRGSRNEPSNLRDIFEFFVKFYSGR